MVSKKILPVQPFKSTYPFRRARFKKSGNWSFPNKKISLGGEHFSREVKFTSVDFNHGIKKFILREWERETVWIFIQFSSLEARHSFMTYLQCQKICPNHFFGGSAPFMDKYSTGQLPLFSLFIKENTIDLSQEELGAIMSSLSLK